MIKHHQQNFSQHEIFRHLRPKWFNPTKHLIEPLSHGGISFLLKPVAARTYNFWIYICPENASFSSRQAIKSLRSVVNNDIIPWGTLVLNDKPILNQLIEFLITEQQFLPSEVRHQVLRIVSK